MGFLVGEGEHGPEPGMDRPAVGAARMGLAFVFDNLKFIRT